MTQPVENNNDLKKLPFLVLIAGIPRSGSTWVFNAARFILDEHYGSIHAVWCADYDVADKSAVHLVKVHTQREAEIFRPDIVLSTQRDIAECIASLIRMGWAKNHADNIVVAARNQKSLYEYWYARSDLEVKYEKLVSEPVKEIVAIANVFGIPLDVVDAERIAQEVSRLMPPSNGRYDPVTLLHPGHRSNQVSANALTKDVRRILKLASE